MRTAPEQRGQSADLARAGRPPRRPVRRPRPLTERQLRKRMQAMLVKIAALGATHQLTAGEIRYRLLLLQRQVRETTLDRCFR